MSLQSRTASGKQAMIQSANQAVGDASAPPSAAWYLTKIEMEPGLTTATMSGGATDFDTAISLSVGTGANLPDNTNTPYRVKVTNALYPGIFEVMNVTNIAGDTITVERGKDETTAEIWGPSSVVAPRFIEPTYKEALTLVASRPFVIAESDDGIVLCEYSSAFVSGSTYETTYILHCHDPADGSVIWSHTVSETTTGSNNTCTVFGSIEGDNLAFFVRHRTGTSTITSVDCVLVLLSMTDGSEAWDADVSANHSSVSSQAMQDTAIMRIVDDEVIVAAGSTDGFDATTHRHAYAVADGAYSHSSATEATSARAAIPCAITPSGIMFFLFTALGTIQNVPIYSFDGLSLVDTTGQVLYSHPNPTTAAIYQTSRFHSYSASDDALYIYSRNNTAPSSPAQLLKYDLYSYSSASKTVTAGMGGPANVTDSTRFAEASGFIWGLAFLDTDMTPIFAPRPAREDTDGEFVTYTNAFTPISDRDGSMYFISADYDRVHNYIDDL